VKVRQRIIPKPSKAKDILLRPLGRKKENSWHGLREKEDEIIRGGYQAKFIQSERLGSVSSTSPPRGNKHRAHALQTRAFQTARDAKQPALCATAAAHLRARRWRLRRLRACAMHLRAATSVGRTTALPFYAVALLRPSLGFWLRNIKTPAALRIISTRHQLDRDLQHSRLALRAAPVLL